MDGDVIAFLQVTSISTKLISFVTFIFLQCSCIDRFSVGLFKVAHKLIKVEKYRHSKTRSSHLKWNCFQTGGHLQLRFDCEPALKAFQGEVKDATVEPGIPIQEVLNLAASKYLKTIDPSKPEDFNGFVEYLEKVRKVLVVDAKEGSVIIILECATLEILEGLWEDYNTGHMKEVVQKCLVTDDIIEEFGDVKLIITISEEEYKACRYFFSQGSGKFKCFLRTCFVLKINNNKK